MQDPNVEAPGTPGAVNARGPELAVAALLAAIGALVIADSLRVGAGWGDDGPRAGYFPFYIGLMLVGASLWIGIVELVKGHARGETFVTRDQAKSVLSILLPMVVYVAAIKLVGIYVASAALIGWFMARHGTHRHWITALVAVGVPIVFFLVFERWFLVPLPKGPIEAMLGF